MEINKRIEKVINDSKLSFSEFADLIEVQRSSISHIISGRNKPSLDFIEKIKSKFPDIEWDWLITGKGDMKIKSTSPTIKEPEKKVDLFSHLINTEENKEVDLSKNNFRNNSKIKRIVFFYEDGTFESYHQ